MASRTYIANRTLSKLGHSRVSNVDTENIEAAKVIRYMWDSVRDSLLELYPWNFATARTQLAKLSDAPAWGYSNKYLLPTDFLTLLTLSDSSTLSSNTNPDYRIEIDDGQRVIVTDASSPIYLIYTSRVEDTGIYPALFVEAFATRMAYEGCEQITQSNTKKQIFSQEFDKIIQDAYRADAIQNPPDPLPDDSWVDVRY